MIMEADREKDAHDGLVASLSKVKVVVGSALKKRPSLVPNEIVYTSDWFFDKHRYLHFREGRFIRDAQETCR
jgi:hypothetical protein